MALIRCQRPENLDAWAHYHKAVGAIALKGWREDAIGEALAELQLAVSSDPDFGLAHAQGAVLTALGVDTGLIPHSADVEQRVLDAVERAVTLDEGSSTVLGYAGCALGDLGHFERGGELLRQALEIDPSNAGACVALGALMVKSGEDVAAGIEQMRFGMRISPKDRRLGFWGSYPAWSYLRMGQNERALEEARTSHARDRRQFLSRVVEAAALQRLGRYEEAVAALAAARQIRETLSLVVVTRFLGEDVGKLIEQVWSQRQAGSARGDISPPARPDAGLGRGNRRSPSSHGARPCTGSTDLP